MREREKKKERSRHVYVTYKYITLNVTKHTCNRAHV
jgi:hypothetical protein